MGIVVALKFFPIKMNAWALTLWCSVQYLQIGPWIASGTFTLYSYLFM